MSDPRYPIGVVCEIVGLHAQTLRAYERKGLVVPARRRGRRLYSEEDLERLRQIVTLTRDLGVNLAGVEVILNMREERERLRAQMRDFVGRLQDLLEREREAAGREGAIVRMVHEGLVRMTEEPGDS